MWKFAEDSISCPLAEIDDLEVEDEKKEYIRQMSFPLMFSFKK